MATPWGLVLLFFRPGGAHPRRLRRISAPFPSGVHPGKNNESERPHLQTSLLNAASD
jgi:hypothetical protein